MNDVDNNSQALDVTKGWVGWISNSITDYDGDGCSDNVEDNDNDNDDVNNNLDKYQWSIGLDIKPSSDFDIDGYKDDDLEDLDDDNDNVSVLKMIVQNHRELMSVMMLRNWNWSQTAGQDNGISVNEIAGISIIVILAIAIIAYFGGYLTHSIINDDESEATSAELIEYIENLEEHIASADKISFLKLMVTIEK